MASYATYRHIELDKVGYSKKRIRNPSSEIFKVLSPIQPDNQTSAASALRTKNVRNTLRNRDSFERLFGNTLSANNNKKYTPRKVQDFGHRNPVTGDGVTCWDSKMTSPKIYKERNPVTGEFYYISSPATTPTKTTHLTNGFKTIPNGILEAAVNNATTNENSS